MVEVRLLLLRGVLLLLRGILLLCIVHMLLARLLHQGLVLAVDDFLLLLHHIARGAAAGAEAVGAAVALEVVLGAHVAAVDPGENEGDAETHETAEGSTLWVVSGYAGKMGGRRTEPLQQEWPLMLPLFLVR